MRKTGSEMALLLVSEKDVNAVTKEMSLFVNSFSIQESEFLNTLKSLSRKQQQIFTNICWAWFKKLTTMYCKGYYDDRNRRACMQSIEICTAIQNKSNCPVIDADTFEAKFVEILSNDHRTLQQSFTGICLKWFKLLAEENRRPFASLVKKNPESFGRLPMI